MEMKTSSISFFFFLFFSFHLSSFVNSQSDSCSSNLLNLRGLPFDASNLQCNPVWNTQDYILRYSQTKPDVWSFILSAPNTNSYIAIGFSTNGRMVGSSAIVGWIPAAGPGVVERYFLGAQNPNQVLPDQGSLKVINNSTAIISQSSRLYLAFQLNTIKPETKLIYSVGPKGIFPTTRRLLTQHRDEVSTNLDYQSGQSKSQSRPYTRLRRSHGILNMIGWGIMLMIGTMVARYLRHMDPLWFYLHACIQLVAFILGVSGVIAGLVLEDILSAQVDRHKTIGILILILGCLQVIAFLARPNKESKVRKYWNWYHYTVGRLLIVLAISNVFYGIKVGKEKKGWNAGYAVTIALLFITAIGLEIRMKMKKQQT